MRATRRFLEEMTAMRGEMSAMHGEMVATRGEIRTLHEENTETLRFMGEVIRRNERAFVEFRDELRELRAEARESREEARAQTRAIFALVDRLEGGGAAA